MRLVGNDPCVVPFWLKLLLLSKAFALYRGAIRRERPAFHPSFRTSTNLNHFYPVAGAKRKLTKSRSTGLGAGAAGIRNTANGYIQNPHNVRTESKIQLG